MKRYSWGDVPESPLPAENGGSVLRRFVGGEQMTVARVTFAAGSVLPVHRHPNEQFSVLLEGALEFVIGGRTVVAHAGDVVHLASNETHGARALEDSVVLDVFAPPRDDWGAPDAPDRVEQT